MRTDNCMNEDLLKYAILQCFYYVLISVDHATKQIWTVISVNSIRLLISGLMLPAAAARPWATLIPRVKKRIGPTVDLAASQNLYNNTLQIGN